MFLPCAPLRAMVDCTCDSWRTSTEHRQQTPLDGCSSLVPFFSDETKLCQRETAKQLTLHSHAVKSHPDGAEVHGLLNDVVVVMQAQTHHVDGGVEGPRVRVVPPRQHLLQDFPAAAQGVARSRPLFFQLQVFLGSLDGPPAAPLGDHQETRLHVVLHRGQLIAERGGGDWR